MKHGLIVRHWHAKPKKKKKKKKNLARNPYCLSSPLPFPLHSFLFFLIFSSPLHLSFFLLLFSFPYYSLPSFLLSPILFFFLLLFPTFFKSFNFLIYIFLFFFLLSPNFFLENVAPLEGKKNIVGHSECHRGIKIIQNLKINIKILFLLFELPKF